MREYFAIVESFETTADELRRASDAERTRAGAALAEEAARALARHRPDDLEKLMVWHTDKLYRVLNAVPLLDASSFVVLRALGSAFGAITKERGVAIAYVVDNGVPEDRLRGVHAAFSALGFMVASPELFAVKLGEADGVPSDQALGPMLGRYRVEAIMLARRLFDGALDDRRHCVWLSGECDADDLRAVARTLDRRPYVGVFRNDAPVDGTNVQIFRTRGKSEELAF